MINGEFVRVKVKALKIQVRGVPIDCLIFY